MKFANTKGSAARRYWRARANQPHPGAAQNHAPRTEEPPAFRALRLKLTGKRAEEVARSWTARGLVVNSAAIAGCLVVEPRVEKDTQDRPLFNAYLDLLVAEARRDGLTVEIVDEAPVMRRITAFLLGSPLPISAFNGDRASLLARAHADAEARVGHAIALRTTLNGGPRTCYLYRAGQPDAWILAADSRHAELLDAAAVPDLYARLLRLAGIAQGFQPSQPALAGPAENDLGGPTP